MKRKLQIILVITVAALLLFACAPAPVTPDPSGEIVIVQIDQEGAMRFSPENIVLTAGQPVRLIVQNQGEKSHEFMIGSEVAYRSSDGAPIGFEDDFFEGIDVAGNITLGQGVMLMGIEGMEGMDMGEGMGEEGMGEEGMEEEGEEHGGFMLMSNPSSGTTILEFTVPEDKVGTWIIGCFLDNGSHFEDGMRATLTVVAP